MRLRVVLARLGRLWERLRGILARLGTVFGASWSRLGLDNFRRQKQWKTSNEEHLGSAKCEPQAL